MRVNFDGGRGRRVFFTNFTNPMMHPSIIVIFVVMMIIKLFGDLEEEIL
jgi:hypothetical protein